MQTGQFFSNLYWKLHAKRYCLLVAAFSILLNWAGNTFVYENSYKFLYFDTMGTFVAVVVLGSVWGIIVALASSILLSMVTSPHFIYLAVVNIIAAFYWGILCESGALAVLKTKGNALKSTLKSSFISSAFFVLFAGVGCGLLTALCSSVIRGVVFQGVIFDQPYSLYFAEWFRGLFSVSGSGWASVFANYVADTFIEIPDKTLSVFFGAAICLTIFKFNIKVLTDTYQDEMQNSETPLYKIILQKAGLVEMLLLALFGAVYCFKAGGRVFEMLRGLAEKAPVYSVRDYLFVEAAAFTVIAVVFIILTGCFAAKKGETLSIDFRISARDNFYIKNMGKDLRNFLINTFMFSAVILIVYLYILMAITGISPVAYYNVISPVKANPSTLVWLLVMLIIFILLDRRNNDATEAITLNDELVKRRTVEHMSESFDAQKQKLQSLELDWSGSTVEFLRGARHDLINQLEKSKTGMDELLVEVYDNVVKPYRNSILESQKEMRSYIEEITNGVFEQYSFKDLEKELKTIADSLAEKTASYISVSFTSETDKNKTLYCRINKLFFMAVNNILDNSVYALQKKVMDPEFKAVLNISIFAENGPKIAVKIVDNAGGLSKEGLARIYKFPIESSKGERLGEGTVIAKNFINLFGGYITAQNRDYGGAGLETVIRLPAYEK